MRTLYNEGRVRGLDAYESYIRQMLATNPEATILSEREWLSSIMNAGSSMVLKIAAGTTAGYHDYELPEASDLCACTSIHASIFRGAVNVDNEQGYWGTEIIDNGTLLRNDAEVYPSTPGTPSFVPTMPNPEVISSAYAEQCRNYAKVIAGLAFQPGEWFANSPELLTENGVELTTEDGVVLLADMWLRYIPNFSGRAFIRLAFSADITSDFYILLSGFTMKTIASGSSGLEQPGTSDPANGGYLGPQEIPPGTKIVLDVTTDVMKVLYDDLKAQIQS